MDFRQEFIEFALAQNVLRFGEFKTKAGRLSPYFFNAGLFNDGAALDRLSQFYAKAIMASGVEIDMLFGPAYKGIPLAATTAEQAALDKYSYMRSFYMQYRLNQVYDGSPPRVKDFDDEEAQADQPAAPALAAADSATPSPTASITARGSS